MPTQQHGNITMAINKEELDTTFIARRGSQLSPKEKARANAQHKQKASKKTRNPLARPKRSLA